MYVAIVGHAVSVLQCVTTSVQALCTYNQVIDFLQNTLLKHTRCYLYCACADILVASS